jgi:hypothetical protein
MKEQQPISNQNELTNQPNSSNLGGEGIFMAEPGNTESNNLPPSQEPSPIDSGTFEENGSNLNEPILTQNGNAILGRIFMQMQGNLVDYSKEELRRIADSMDKSGIAANGSQGLEEARRQYAARRHEEVVQNVQKEISENVDQIKHKANAQEAAEDIDRFLVFADEAKKVLTEQEKETFNQKINEISSLREGDINLLKVKIEEFSKEVEKHFKGPDLSLDKPLPESLEELAAIVMNQAGEEWKTGGEKQLVDENGRVVRENFIAWVRQRMIDLHEFNPTTKVNFFSDINVKVGYSQISFYDMIFTGSYFLEKKKINVMHRVGDKFDKQEEDVYVKNQDYEDMKQQLIMEAFLFSSSRNNDVEYVANMWNETELPKLINQMYYANPFMRGSYLEKVLTMSSMSKEKIEGVRSKVNDEGKFDKEKIKSILENNSDVGEGIRRALLSYYYMNDFDMLQKILVKDSALFREEYSDIDASTGKRKKDENGAEIGMLKGVMNQEFIETDKNKKEEDQVSVIYENGEVADTEKGRERFIKYINVFNDAHKDEKVVEEVRERIRQSLMEKLEINYSEAKYAEAWAFSMTRWSGIGARNDIKAVGFDAWSKAQNLMEYRLKQMDPKRRGVAGNVFNLAGIKRASLSMFEGITDVHGRTILEAIQGGQGEDGWSEENPFKEKEKMEEGQRLRFKQDMAQRFASNHVGNAFKIYDFINNHTEFNIENMVTYDSLGRPIIDQEKANKMIDGIQKAIRYAYCTWGGTDYSKTIRVWEHNQVLEMPVAAAMFGPDILKLIAKDIERRTVESNAASNTWVIDPENDNFELDFSKVQANDEREMLWKHILGYLVAEEIHSHRSVKSSLKRFDYAMVEKIYDFIKVKGLVSNEEEIKDMRELSNSRLRRLFAEDFLIDGGKGTLEGFWKMMRIMLKDIASGK